LARDRNFARTFLDELSDKILFGTDNCSLGQENLIKTLGLSKNTLRNIMGEVAGQLIPSGGDYC